MILFSTHPHQICATSHCGDRALRTTAPPEPLLAQRGPAEHMRSPTHRLIPTEHWALNSAFFPNDPLRGRRRAPPTQAAGAASPPHLLRVLPDEQMRNARPAAAALRMPPPDHRTENDTGVARLQFHKNSEGVCMGQA